MRLGEGVGDELPGETNADFQSAGAGGRQDAVVEAFAAAEASAAGIEGEPRTEERVDLAGGNFRQGGGGFGDAEVSGEQVGLRIFHRVEDELIAEDAWVGPADFGVAGDEFQQGNFARQCGENGEGPEIRLIADPCVQSGAGRRRIRRRVGHELPHAFAERGLAER